MSGRPEPEQWLLRSRVREVLAANARRAEGTCYRMDERVGTQCCTPTRVASPAAPSGSASRKRGSSSCERCIPSQSTSLRTTSASTHPTGPGLSTTTTWSAENACRLADLDQVPIRVANVRSDLASMVLRLREELRSFGGPFLVDLVDVRNADVEERARAARVGRRRESDGGLVVCGTAADIEDQPRVRDLHDDRVALQENLPVEQRPIELTGWVLIGNDEKVS